MITIKDIDVQELPVDSELRKYYINVNAGRILSCSNTLPKADDAYAIEKTKYRIIEELYGDIIYDIKRIRIESAGHETSKIRDMLRNLIMKIEGKKEPDEL